MEPTAPLSQVLALLRALDSRRPLVFALLLVADVSVSAQDITRDQAQQLLAQCETERAEKIAPLKAQAIKDCVESQRKAQDDCERHNRNYGQRTAAGTGPGMFWELPVCEQAIKLERYFMLYPGRQVYSP